ncbi:hypothetical protein TNCV_1203081 [Trichonephila clavipes]|nr:hypothetical protein TNCV_1203081 [Trichonephila clavipes]
MVKALTPLPLPPTSQDDWLLDGHLEYSLLRRNYTFTNIHAFWYSNPFLTAPPSASLTTLPDGQLIVLDGSGHLLHLEVFRLTEVSFYHGHHLSV